MKYLKTNSRSTRSQLKHRHYAPDYAVGALLAHYLELTEKLRASRRTPSGGKSKEGGIVKEISIKIWRNIQGKNWTLEMNGSRYQDVTIEWIHEVVYAAILDAEDLLMERTKGLAQ